MTIREMIFCPEHRQRDCSPLLNGCSRVIEAHKVIDQFAEMVIDTEALVKAVQTTLEAFDEHNGFATVRVDIALNLFKAFEPFKEKNGS